MIRISFLMVFLFSLISGCGGSSDGNSIHYSALGASDVVGIGATPLTNGYVYLIEDSIEQQRGESVHLTNLGIPGADVGAIREVSVAIMKRSATPDLVTVSTGANDVIQGSDAASFENDLKGLLSDLRAIAPSSTIAIATIPNLTEVPRFRENPDPDVTSNRLSNFNAAIRRQAAAYNALLVDLYSVPLSDSLVSEIDGFHPSDAGHRVIADQFLTVLASSIPTL
jgi:lysophospholipase L1-like esterase